MGFGVGILHSIRGSSSVTPEPQWACSSVVLESCRARLLTRVLLAGMVPGLLLSVATIWLARHLLFGSVGANSIAVVGAAIILGLAGMLATILPARRAGLADPLETLRSEWGTELPHVRGARKFTIIWDSQQWRISHGRDRLRDNSGGEVSVKNLFESSSATEIKERIILLRPDSRKQWGAMSVAQMLAHCSAWMEMAAGLKSQKQSLIGRIVGKMAKKSILGEEPIRRNMPTDKVLIIQDERDFAAEQRRLLDLVDRFSKGGPDQCTTHPHSFFGSMTPTEWAAMGYKHLDHHLRQFGAWY
jgi:hypothetical protein